MYNHNLPRLDRGASQAIREASLGTNRLVPATLMMQVLVGRTTKHILPSGQHPGREFEAEERAMM